VSSGLSNCFGFQTALQGGDTIANSVAATIFASTVTLPAKWLNVVGRSLRLHGWGIYSTDAALGRGITIELMAGTTVLATGTGTLSLAAAVNDGWQFEADVTCRSTGAGGTVEVQGKTTFDKGALGEDVFWMTNAAALGLDLTVSQVLGIRITWAVADPDNSITQRIFYPERLQNV